MKRLCVLLAVLIVISMPVASFGMDNDVYVTRAEFIKDILTAANINVGEVLESSFEDVTDPDYIAYIETAYEKGIVSGYGETFNPDGNITKEQAVAIIVNVFGEKAALEETSQQDVDGILSFSDCTDISEWAKPYIAYALDIGLVKEDSGVFSPQTLITADQAESLISGAASVYETLFTREGLSASDMMMLASEKSDAYSTYKQKGTMKTNMQMKIDGLPQEEIDNNPDIAALLGEGMDMDIDIEVHAQTPDKAYIKEVIKSDTLEEEKDQEIEMFMDGPVMYTKITGVDKWAMQDMGPIMDMAQSVSGSDPYKVSQISNDELEFFKEYASFEEDEVLDGSEHYVIYISIDKDTYREYYTEIMEKTMDSVVQLQTESAQFQESSSLDPEQYKQMMMQLISDMEVEIEYRFYINKETKDFEKMWISQNINMPMQQLISTVAAAVGDDAPDIDISMTTHTEGEFIFYDFDEEIEFPEISPEDIMDPSQPLPEPGPEDIMDPSQSLPVEE